MDELPIVECRLDVQGLRAQRRRYRRLGRTVCRIERGPQTLTVGFGADVDAALLAETVAIESECCSFFALRYDDDARELFVRVADPELDPALDALVFALDVPAYQQATTNVIDA